MSISKHTHLAAALIAISVLALSMPAQAGRNYYIRGANATSITNILYPWTQGDDCGECCVC